MKKSIGAQTIVFPTPVFIIGSFDEKGRPNAAAVAWGGICCSNPPSVSIALRGATYTHTNITKQKAFTVNLPSEKYIKQADYFGLVSGRTEDKFSATGLSPIKSEIVNAPYIKEFPLVLECSLLHSVQVGLHTQFIGEIKDIKVDQSVIDADNRPDIEKIKPFTYNPANRTYYGIGKYLGDAFSIGRKKRS